MPQPARSFSGHVALILPAAGLTISAFDEMLYSPNPAALERPSKTAGTTILT
jgi:hypothetical protein